VKIFDLRFCSSSQVLNSISENDIQRVGISVMTGPQIHYALKISRIIKENFKDVQVVWGGIHSTILPSQILKNKLIDFVIRGEGEHSYYELISGMGINRINGLSFKKANKIHHNPDSNNLTSLELNKLNIPWDLIDPRKYVINKTINMITSRGCPFRCAFCYNTLFNNVWRGWTAEKCINEFDIALNLGAKKFNFYDDYFFANSERNLLLFQYFKQQDIEWKAELRISQLTRKMANQLKGHGCSQLFFGAESGSQRILNILGKNMKVNDIIQSARITRDADIFADYSWMIGIPGENWTDVRKTINVIKKVNNINENCEFSIKILYPYPKTPIYERALAQGFNPPNNLHEWGEIRRERAPDYLKNKNLLEMISITSAIVGKKIFEQNAIPTLRLIKLPASFRWNHEVFAVGIENLTFKVFRKLFEKVISTQRSIEYDQFSHKFIMNKK
jgi:anaerobic magnesium-protoporphyrin IX monomethyl ester cyclase